MVVENINKQRELMGKEFCEFLPEVSLDDFINERIVWKQIVFKEGTSLAELEKHLNEDWVETNSITNIQILA